MGFLQRLFGAAPRRGRLEPLYEAVVATARDRHWYLEGAVPDTIDGRFDMIAALLALVILRLEKGEDREAPTMLTELFIDDMEGSLRQLGIGDLMVGKHVGKMVGALGGRLAAFREASGDSLEAAVRRNIFHEAPLSNEALAFVAGRLALFERNLATLAEQDIVEGRLPAL